MDNVQVLLLTKLALRVLELLTRALAGHEVTDAEVDAALDRADAADGAWAEANESRKPEEEQDDG